MIVLLLLLFKKIRGFFFFSIIGFLPINLIFVDLKSFGVNLLTVSVNNTSGSETLELIKALREDLILCFSILTAQ